MTLVCSKCGSRALEITAQSYHVDSAFEAYRCENCGATGSLSHDGYRTTLGGSVESDGRYR